MITMVTIIIVITIVTITFNNDINDHHGSSYFITIGRVYIYGLQLFKLPKIVNIIIIHRKLKQKWITFSILQYNYNFIHYVIFINQLKLFIREL